MLQLSAEGLRIDKFGLASADPRFNALQNTGFVEAGKEHIWVLRKHSPLLTIIDRSSHAAVLSHTR